jgi:hypothetical protein
MYFYVVLHGSYGIAWIVKDIIFPDRKLMEKHSIASNIGLFIFLACYWTIPIPLAAGYGITHPSLERIIAVILMFIMGLTLMLGSDYQKAIRLKQKPGKNTII